jgi:hypothetical protein
LRRIASRAPPSAPRSTSRIACAFSAGEPPRSSPGRSARSPSSSGSIIALVHRAVDDLADAFGPAGESSSIPARRGRRTRARAELREHLGDRPDERGA